MEMPSYLDIIMSSNCCQVIFRTNHQNNCLANFARGCLNMVKLLSDVVICLRYIFMQLVLVLQDVG